MNVTLDKTVTAANRVWYDPRTDLIHAEIAGVDHAIPLSKLPEEDFESQASISGFALGQGGAVIVLRHVDGAETWFPSDMWLPGGFTPIE